MKTPDECFARAQEILAECEAIVDQNPVGVPPVIATALNLGYTRATALLAYSEAQRERERRERNRRFLLGDDTATGSTTTDTTQEN